MAAPPSLGHSLSSQSSLSRLGGSPLSPSLCLCLSLSPPGLRWTPSCLTPPCLEQLPPTAGTSWGGWGGSLLPNPEQVTGSTQEEGRQVLPPFGWGVRWGGGRTGQGNWDEPGRLGPAPSSAAHEPTRSLGPAGQGPPVCAAEPGVSGAGLERRLSLHSHGPGQSACCSGLSFPVWTPASVVTMRLMLNP